MNIFNLPDLGEGLPDAEIHEWFVKEGETVKADQPLVSMETAKAVVDVPCPEDGVITQLFGKPGDIIKTGSPLVGFEAAIKVDKGTVVGQLEESTAISEDNFTIGSIKTATRSKATPAVRALAKKLNVNLDSIPATGAHGIITREDVEKAAKASSALPEGFEPLRGARRAMLSSMVQSHEEVVAVSIFDEANIQAWSSDTDITVRLIRALTAACKAEPSLNAWFDGKQAARKCFEEVHLGLAMDTEEGLFVPVIHDAAAKTDAALRLLINEYKQSVSARTVAPDKLKGATITLSNFGKFAGRFATPIIVPPMVAIIAVGRLYDQRLPISLSFDHRAVTGGEATRFLAHMITVLQQP